MNSNNSKKKYPNILVISNNPFSSTTNNGKTLASFFAGYPVSNIAQLYFNHETPNSLYYKNYFRITDIDIFKSIFKTNNKCGEIIYEQNIFKDNRQQQINNGFVNLIKRYNLARIIRDSFWASNNWKTVFLNHWLNNFCPEIIFFCAGDSGFAYDITMYIQKMFNTKLVLFITDDYIFPRKSISPFWWFRRNYILSKMRDSIIRCNLFITISEQMRKEYKKFFGKDSIVAVNIPEDLKDESMVKKEKNISILVYAGSLNHKRYKTLYLLAKSLKRNNISKNKIKAYLKIYSTQRPSKRIRNLLNVKNSSEFCGGLNSKQLKYVLNSSDILVHVESFDSRSIESTMFSISTKIPEYLSLGKSILAIGPPQVASMEYLKDSAFCITKQSEIYCGLQKILNNNNLQKELSKKAIQKYKKNHNKKITSKELLNNIKNLIKN